MKKYSFEKIDATGLAVFRMFYMIILGLELLQLYKYRGIIYGQDSILNFGEINPEYIFKFWFAIVIFLFLGLFTRLSSIINYLFSVIIFSSASGFAYHVFYAYVGLNFLLMFMPISRVLSLDSLIKKIKYSDIGSFYKPDNKVLAANYLIPVFVGIGLVYIDSILFKFSSPMWLKGLGIWLPANLPMVTWSDNTWIMNHEYFIKFLGYLVLAFETVFIFLFWFKPFRIPFMLIGIFFHLGILIEFPIPWFALTAIAVYLLMVPVSWWKKIVTFLKSKKPSYKFYYDAECPLCIKTVVIIRHFDVFNKVLCISVQGNYQNERVLDNITEEELLINIHGVNSKGKVLVGYDAYVGILKALIYTYPIGLFIGLPIISYFGKKFYAYIAGNRLTVRCTSETCLMPIIQKPFAETQDYLVEGFNQLNLTKKFWIAIFAFFTLAQGIISWKSPLTQNTLGVINLRNTRINAWAMKPYEYFSLYLKKYIGITQHDVFLDGHFNGFNHIIMIKYNTVDGRVLHVPILKENGMVDDLVSGAIWCNISFNAISPILAKEKLEKWLPRYFQYFKVNIEKGQLPSGKFFIYVKEIETSKDWEKDFLRKQMEKPWIKAGEFTQEKESNLFTWTEEMEQIFEEEKVPK